MAFSSIKKKLCKCGCGKWPTCSYQGYNQKCAPQEIKDNVLGKRMSSRTSSLKRTMSKLRGDNYARKGIGQEQPSEAEIALKVALNEWFNERHSGMRGFCVECGGKTTKGDTKYWKFSICHLLGKALFPSIATNPLNFIELCYFGNSHHSNMDNNGYEYVREHMPKTWKIILERVEIMFPFIKEKSKIPEVIMRELPDSIKK